MRAGSPKKVLENKKDAGKTKKHPLHSNLWNTIDSPNKQKGALMKKWI